MVKMGDKADKGAMVVPAVRPTVATLSVINEGLTAETPEEEVMVDQPVMGVKEAKAAP